MQTKTNAVEIFDEISNIVTEIAHQTGNRYFYDETDKAEPVKTSNKLMQQVQEVCSKRDMKSTIMPSWAGHDVAHLGVLEKILLFIKSTGGSHNPQENTTKEDIEKGIITLEGTVEEDIKQVHRAVEQVEYLENNSIHDLIGHVDSNTKKGAIRKILFGIAEARSLGVKVQQRVQDEIKKEIIANRDNLEK